MGRLRDRWLSLRLPWRRRWLAGTDIARNRYYFFRPTLGWKGPPRRIMEPAKPERIWFSFLRPRRNSAETARVGAGVGPGKYYSSTRLGDFADIRVPIQWHQWLRYTRTEPPSLEEQQADVVRRDRMRVLAAEADKRWEEAGSLVAPGSASTTTSQKNVDGSLLEQMRRAQEGDVQRPEIAADATAMKTTRNDTGGGAESPQTVTPSQEPLKTTSDESSSPGHSPPSPPTSNVPKTNERFKDPSKPPRPPPSWARKDRGTPGEAYQPEAWTPTSSR